MDMMHGFTYLYMKPILILQMVYIKCKIFQILYLWETNNTKLLQFVLLYGLTVKKNNYNNKLTHKYQMKLKWIISLLNYVKIFPLNMTFKSFKDTSPQTESLHSFISFYLDLRTRWRLLSFTSRTSCWSPLAWLPQRQPPAPHVPW